MTDTHHPSPGPEDARQEPFHLLPIFASATPTLAHQPPPQVIKGSLLDQLLGAVDRSAEGKLYAIADAAQDLEVAFTARLLGHPVHTLFSGDMAPTLAHVGPCLIELADPRAYLAKWTGAIGKNAGLLFETSADLETLGKHLRGIFVVTDEESQEYFFRFYDPRVLRAFLPTCTPGELRELFGPIRRWIVENEDGTGYRTYRLTGDKLETTELGVHS